MIQVRQRTGSEKQGIMGNLVVVAMKATTPILGKLSDLINRKILVLLSGGLPNRPQPVRNRPGHHVAHPPIGGPTALVQIVMADLMSPRERDKYMGVIVAIMGVGTVAGPLIDGVITNSIGWKWGFWVFVPFSLAALVLIQKTLRLPKRSPQPVKIDYLGRHPDHSGCHHATALVSLAGTADAVAAGGKNFEWARPPPP